MVKTKILKVNPDNPEKENIMEAVQTLAQGGIVAIPTDTVYGLAANPFDKNVIERLYEIKHRPRTKPFSLLILDARMLENLVGDIPPLARDLIDRFWPGALTMIFENREGKKIGLRMPDHKIPQEIIRGCNFPLACPSANLSGEKPPIEAKGVIEKFNGLVDLIIDGSQTYLGKESTVIDLTLRPPQVLREGAIAKKELNG